MSVKDKKYGLTWLMNSKSLWLVGTKAVINEKNVKARFRGRKNFLKGGRRGEVVKKGLKSKK